MDPQLVQRTRYVLRSRTRRAQTCPNVLLGSACTQLVAWLKNHPFFGPYTSRLVAAYPDLYGRIAELQTQVLEGANSLEPGRQVSKSVEEHGALCWFSVQAVAATVELEHQRQQFMANVMGGFATGEEHYKVDEIYETFRDVLVDGLYEFLDEQIDSRNVTFGLLLKFKQQVEWFKRTEAQSVASRSGHDGGERGLAKFLQEYVFENGFDFVVEPTSASGEVDLVLKDPDGHRLVLDAKLIRHDAGPSDVKRQISTGFHQVARYCDDYNEPYGFLTVFLSTDKRISLELEESDGLRFLRLDGKTIYYLPISIADLPSASKAGQANEISISRDELVKEIASEIEQGT